MTVTMTAPLGKGQAGRSRAEQCRMESVHAAHSRALLRYLLGLTRQERPAAEDLLQETMLRAWRHLDSLPSEEESARKWLFTVARRLAIDAARSRQVRPKEVNLVEAAQMSSVDTADGALAVHALTDAFHALSAPHQQVLQELHLRGASVVDSKLKVYGTANVRVVDASVLPMQISGHLQAALYAVSERISDIIKAEYA